METKFNRTGTATCRFSTGPLLRRFVDLDQPGGRAEQVLQVNTARVVFANYDLIRYDFPQLRKASDTTINKWLIRYGAVVSVQQTRQSSVNTPIQTVGPPRRAFRPPLYGRATVVAVPGGLLDVKGAGVAADVTPTQNWHKNGLLMLGAALGSAAFYELIFHAFRHSGGSLGCVPEYAIIDLGFDARLEGGGTQPVCIQLRRAHRRQRGGGDLPSSGSHEEQVKLEAELLLRHYGITSCAPETSLFVEERRDGTYVGFGENRRTRLASLEVHGLRTLPGYETGSRRYEGLNIQMTREHGVRPARAQLVDFGQYTCRQHFDFPLLSMAVRCPLRWSRAIGVGSPHFPQPDPDLVVPDRVWGLTRGENDHMPPHPGGGIWPHPYVVTFGLAKAFRAGEVDGVGVRQRIDDLVQAATSRWS